MKVLTYLTATLFVLLGIAGGAGAAKISQAKKTELKKTTPAVVATPTVVEQVPATTTPASRAGEEINWQVLSSGGGMVQVGALTLGSTIGQSFAGTSTIGTNTLHSGFWQNWTTGPGCCVIRGDVNHSGEAIPDISDLVFMVNWQFLFGPEPVCQAEADVNGSGGTIDISDLVYLVNYMFHGGSDLVPCP
ncbi:MAG: hypothetical protein ABIE70_09645 [bacterium]